jgi:NTP pyrophosphatase (non-canonical NTP hydrolase)
MFYYFNINKKEISMEINEYQTKAREWIDYPTEIGPYSIILALQEHVGSLSGKLNKVLKQDGGQFTKEESTKAAISLGDILFDICNLAYDLNHTMDEVISLNMLKHQMEQEKKVEKIV